MHKEVFPKIALKLSRERQLKWYDEFRKEFKLDQSDFVDEQDLLDWIGAYASIIITKSLVL